MVKHTPTPWRECGGATPHYKAIHSQDGYIVFGFADKFHDRENGEPIKCPSYEVQRANAKFIELAVNTHDDLVEAATAAFIHLSALFKFNLYDKDSYPDDYVVQLLSKALENAKEK